MSTKFELDCSGLSCPMPIIKLSKMMRKDMEVGDIVHIIATDMACKTDLEAWCAKTGNKLIEVSDDSGKTQATIEKTVKM